MILNVFKWFCSSLLSNSRTYSSPAKETLYTLAVSPHTHPLAATALLSVSICLSWTFHIKKPCNMWPFASGFFYLALYFQGSAMLEPVLALHPPFWWLILHWVYIPQFVYFSVDGHFKLFSFLGYNYIYMYMCMCVIMPLWTFVHKFLWRH